MFFLEGFEMQISNTSLETGLLSPVRLLSSILIPFDLITSKPAGITSPREMYITSPTSKSSDLTFTF